MADVVRINATGVVKTESQCPFFIEGATVKGDAASVLEIYDGVDTSGKFVAILSAPTSGADHRVIVNYNCTEGCYATLTETGAGFAVGLIYQR